MNPVPMALYSRRAPDTPPQLERTWECYNFHRVDRGLAQRERAPITYYLAGKANSTRRHGGRIGWVHRRGNGRKGLHEMRVNYHSVKDVPRCPESARA